MPGKEALERLEWLISSNKQSINQKTLVGQNTPLHFAVVHENLKIVEYICR